MKKLFKNIHDSFFNNDSGFSSRKLTAFSLMICIAFIHWEYIDQANAIEALTIDLCGVLIALGIVTAQNIIELKNGKQNGTETN